MIKPLLAPRESPDSCKEFWNKVKFPILVSPKLDGIRGIIINGQATSRTGKPLPSSQIQKDFTSHELLDGEFIEGLPTDTGVYNRTQSHVMSLDKPGDIRYYVFDYLMEPERPFVDRLHMLSLIDKPKNTFVLPHELAMGMTELLAYEEIFLSAGYEGVILRDPMAPYKFGRATLNQGIIFKLKRFEDAEGVIVDFKEQMTNNNTLETDELGYAKRSHHQAGKSPAGMLGGLVVMHKGMELDVAPGCLTHHERKLMWEDQKSFLGQIVKFKYFAYGVKDKPRFPRVVGFRTLGT